LGGTFQISSIFLIVAIITKRAQYPISGWLPAAMAAPTPVSALVHSSTLVTAGILLLVKINKNFNGCFILFFLGLLTILIAGVTAMKEKDFKKIVALSTLRQLGFLVFIFSQGFYFLCFFHLLAHAFFKSLLFFGVGRILHLKTRLQDTRIYGPSLTRSWFVIFLITITLISLCGLLFTSGFFSKDLFLIIILGRTYRGFMLGVGGLIIFTTFFYSVGILQKVWSLGEEHKIKNEASCSFSLSCFILILLTILFGSVYSINFVYRPENNNYALIFFVPVYVLMG
jgi:NADH-ubiquinone oxidoreductase chain 5